MNEYKGDLIDFYDDHAVPVDKYIAKALILFADWNGLTEEYKAYIRKWADHTALTYWDWVSIYKLMCSGNNIVGEMPTNSMDFWKRIYMRSVSLRMADVINDKELHQVVDI